MKRIAVLFPQHPFSTRDCAIGYSKAFRRLGFHVTDIHYDVLWKKYTEQGLGAERIPRAACRDIVMHIVEACPDLVVVIDGGSTHEVFWNWMRRLDIPTALMMTDCPYYDDVNAHLISYADYPYANDKLSATTMGCDYMPLAYMRDMHKPFIVSDKYKSDVVFVGSCFPERVEILEAVDWAGIDFRLLGYWDLDDTSPLKQYFKQRSLFIDNAETTKFYNGAKIVLNLNRLSIDIEGRERIAERWSVGPRIYEAAACGCAIASQNDVPELKTLLEDHYLPFNTPDELSALLREWLDREDELVEMGKMAHKAVKGHSYLDRAVKMLDKVDIFDQ
jgi:spore maturation protein CgeB